MQIGVIYPQTDLGGDPGTVREYTQTVERLGYRHLVAFDHVVGADPAIHHGWQAPYDVDTTFHEPLVLFGYLAAITSMELVTGVLILPQRQTVLVAKQAAEVDLLTGGRLRLGVGLGWNAVEYEAMGKDFTDRGARSDEQVGLLRRLWTEPSVSHRGASEQVTGAGIAPLPVQRPIPIWFGAASPPAYRRIGRLGDGWFPAHQPGPELDEARTIIDAAAIEAGRDTSEIDMEGRVNWGTTGLDAALSDLDAWRRAGAGYVSINTMNAGFTDLDAHLEALAAIAENIG